jgi:hypothetical protein
MHPDILMVRAEDGYRVLHGHLHLINAFGESDTIYVEARDQGALKVMKTRDGMVVEDGDKVVPVLKY